ncbi:MAG: sigma-70 family RNA polymerase sigma factor [Clostridiales bacterium]|nr:sigma-70 family RNA polymerase sigma factor [Clostridiales bacterium]
MEKYFSLPDTEELVELYANDVLRVCVFYLGSRSLAEDAFQDVFLKAIRKRDTFEGSCPPKYWLMAIARNVCKDYLKSPWSTRTGSYEQMTEDSGEQYGEYRTSNPKITPSVDGRDQEDEYFDQLEPEGDLWDAIMALPNVSKEVVLYRYYCQMDNRSIAEACGVTESTVRSRLFRARKILAKYERKHGRAPGEAYEESV